MKLSWRWKGIIVFLLFAGMEVGDLVGLLGGFSNIDLYTQTTGVYPKDQFSRLVILSIFALGIVISSLFTAFNLWRRRPLAKVTATVTAILFTLYGGFQIISALTQLRMNQALVIFLGIIYIIIGSTCQWLGKKADEELQAWRSSSSPKRPPSHNSQSMSRR